jgi:hypothetical protein
MWRGHCWNPCGKTCSSINPVGESTNNINIANCHLDEQIADKMLILFLIVKPNTAFHFGQIFPTRRGNPS